MIIISPLIILGFVMAVLVIRPQVTIGKILSLLVVLGYALASLVLLLRAGNSTTGFTIADLWGILILFLFTMLHVAILFLPLALIWFPDEIGSMTNIYVGRGGIIDEETPAFLVSLAGWFFLVVLPVLLYLLGKDSS